MLLLKGKHALANLRYKNPGLTLDRLEVRSKGNNITLTLPNNDWATRVSMHVFWIASCRPAAIKTKNTCEKTHPLFLRCLLYQQR